MEVEPYYAPQTAINIVLDKIYGKKATMEAAEEFEAQHAAEYGDDDEEEPVTNEVLEQTKIDKVAD